MRGYAVIALQNPKCGANVGGVMRAAGIYGAALVVIGGERFKTLKRFPTDTMRAWKHLPTVEVADVLDALPHDCVPVAVEIVPGAASLPAYKHPERAMYIFGPEDGSLGKEIIGRCKDVVAIPTKFSMNLASCANVVLYDRLAKQVRIAA